ncbi:MAG: hypothetical protein Q8941_18730 [Bacteroidota bacterium]|nr:hypothetical protein [Bacteroidota bacterium]
MLKTLIVLVFNNTHSFFPDSNGLKLRIGFEKAVHSLSSIKSSVHWFEFSLVWAISPAESLAKAAFAINKI